MAPPCTTRGLACVRASSELVHALVKSPRHASTLATSTPLPRRRATRPHASSSSSSFSRPFSSTRPTPIPRGGGSSSGSSGSPHAHLVHPTVRLRITNLTFYLCAVVSVATVSLTMSGSFGSPGGVVVGCPARNGRSGGVGAQEEQGGDEAPGRARGGRGGDSKRGTGLASDAKGKGKATASRWLDDPSDGASEVWRPTATGRLERVEPATRASTRAGRRSVDETDETAQTTTMRPRVVGRDDGEGLSTRTTSEPEDDVVASRGTGWRGWVGLSGRPGAQGGEPRGMPDGRIV
ncbi:hypothetical protein JCM10212_006970 [Sporobolomyces blumeae]